MTAPSRKQLTHERIVRTASEAIRRSGYQGIGVADLMKQAGLTHGGFYAHFSSKTALLAEAADHAGADSARRLGDAAHAAEAGSELAALIDAYLSDAHLNAPELGCPLAALGGETARQEPEVRHTVTRRVKEVIDLISRQMPGWGEGRPHDAAMAVYATLVGTLVLARAIDDPRLAKALRKASKSFLDTRLA